MTASVYGELAKASVLGLICASGWKMWQHGEQKKQAAFYADLDAKLAKMDMDGEGSPHAAPAYL